MHLACPGVAHHFDDLSRGGAAYDRVVDHDYPLPLEQLTHRVELYFDPEVADGLGWFDKRPADIVVADQAEFERDARFFGIHHRSRDPGVRHRDHDVGIHRILSGQLPSQLLAGHVDVPAEDVRIGAGKIDKLEDARGWFDLLEREKRLDAAVLVADHHFTRFDLANEFGFDQVQGTAFRCDNPGVPELAET